MIFTFLVVTKGGRLKFIFGVPSFVSKDRDGVSQLGNSWIWPKDMTHWALHHTNKVTTQTLGLRGFVHPWHPSWRRPLSRHPIHCHMCLLRLQLPTQHQIQDPTTPHAASRTPRTWTPSSSSYYQHSAPSPPRKIRNYPPLSLRYVFRSIIRLCFVLEENMHLID